MPLASLSAGAATLIGLASAAAGGGISAGINSLTQSKKNKHEKEMETIHTTKPGFDDFGDELVGNEPPRFNLSSAGKPIIFPGRLQKANPKPY